MSKTCMRASFIVWAVLTAFVPTITIAAGPAHKAWLETWQKKNPVWRALHLIGPQPERMGLTEQFVRETLAPMGINVLILEIDYGFEFKSRPELQCHGISKEQARKLSDVCRQNGIRLIPLFNCLGHQSWAKSTAALLKKHPEFDETPQIPANNKGIYCREWCPSNPDVNPVVFSLLDELIEAFDADALHVGMDEVFLIGDEKCPRCKGKDVGMLFAGVVNALHQHLVKDKGVEMLMWGDRLLDAGKFSYGSWEASKTGSHRAIDQIPKDIIICDWHYERRADYPSVRFFQQQGFRVLPSPWKNPDAGVAFIRCARKDATQRMLGVLFTGWSAGGNGERLMAALKGETDGNDKDTAKQVAATIKAGLKELAAPATLAQQTAFPIKVSENKRYFVDQSGTPVFWLGTTQWQLFREYKLEEAKTILEKTGSHGFSFVQVMLLGVGDGTAPNVYAQKPWINNDPLTPNEAYFKNVGAIVRIARDNNLAISMTLYHQRYRQHITMKNARQWAKWLAQRYKDMPNIVWSMTPEARQEFVPVLRELAAGLHAGDEGRHLVTFKPDPAPYSSSFIHAEPWLDFDSMQTWKGVKLIYPMITKDYNLKPVKPVLMAEGAYEAGSEYGFEVTPLWIRRQAYYSYLAGGHHTYGHNDSWRVLPTWTNALDAPGAVQMGLLKKIFMVRKEWWLMVPDQSVFASGGRTEGDALHLAARHQDGKWAMLYLADRASFSVNMNKIAAAEVNVFWVDPVSGHEVRIGHETNAGVKSFTTPKGWEDAILILEAVGTGH